MQNRVKVGVLFNCKANLFQKYLEWIIQKSKDSIDFDLVGIHTNDKKYYDSLAKRNLDTFKKVDDIIEKSDVIFSLGYWRILKKDKIEKVPLGIVNFHNSYNLKYKGRNCSTYVIKNNEAFHGATMHFIDEKVDEGEIIATKKFRINQNDTAEDIFVKATNTGFKLLKENFYNVIKRQKRTLKVPDNEITYTYGSKDLCHEIDKKHLLNEKDFLREIRSLTFNKKPSPYIVLDDHKIYLKMDQYDSGILNKE